MSREQNQFVTGKLAEASLRKALAQEKRRERKKRRAAEIADRQPTEAAHDG
jgi:hypothetical protein